MKINQPIPAANATLVQRQVQWQIGSAPADAPEWFDRSSGRRLGLTTANVTFQVFAKLLGEEIQLLFQSQIEVEIHGGGTSPV